MAVQGIRWAVRWRWCLSWSSHPRGGCLFGAPVVPVRGSVADPCALGGEVSAAQGVRVLHGRFVGLGPWAGRGDIWVTGMWRPPGGLVPAATGMKLCLSMLYPAFQGLCRVFGIRYLGNKLSCALGCSG